MYKEQPKPIKSLPPIEPMDLRSFSRDRDMVSTTISVDIDYQLYPWLRLGQISLNSRLLGDQGTIWILSAYLGEHTDQEHDSANIVRFEVVGLELGHIGYGMTHLTGWIKLIINIYRDRS